ncbi:acetylxylan esterase [Luteimicrobium subarcticum]|uniref:Cephalosporin-C deacetylase n=1 Tax=Luteimicrobium subarcticum TaxID=620910 RepID=A0A2M8WS48_9MICO|nr:acetylxylan esterase [Luteimicrobium subarcticum]PJI93750.1 cephalosporin-C deacetylase [Luteimicrobium subarcticum]
MPFTDLPLVELERFRPDVREPADFDAFWAKTLSKSRAAGAGRGADLVPAETPITEVVVEDLTFPGFGGEPVKGWVVRPRRRPDDAPLPAVVEFNGYNGGRGIAGERTGWALAGNVHVFMDTRGQGSGWGTGGDTPDPHGGGPAAHGWMTRGIEDPRDHYYRRVYTDAALLVEHVRALPFVDAGRVSVTGGSQGGGIAIAAGALASAAAVLPDVAFLCAWEHGMQVATSDPFTELARYLAVHRDALETVLTTASYLDGVNFARRITAPALFSVALMDDVVPPSTTFAAYNALASEDHEIAVYPFNGHEGGQTRQWLRQVEFLRARGLAV